MSTFPKNRSQSDTFPLFPNIRRAAGVLWVFALTLADLHSAPYIPGGLPVDWAQPDGSKLSPGVFIDEFCASNEIPDGHTVVVDAAKNAYFYAEPPTLHQSLFQPWVVSMCSRPIVLFQPNPIRK